MISDETELVLSDLQISWEKKKRIRRRRRGEDPVAEPGALYGEIYESQFRGRGHGKLRRCECGLVQGLLFPRRRLHLRPPFAHCGRRRVTCSGHFVKRRLRDKPTAAWFSRSSREKGVMAKNRRLTNTAAYSRISRCLGNKIPRCSGSNNTGGVVRSQLDRIPEYAGSLIHIGNQLSLCKCWYAMNYNEVFLHIM